MGKECECGKYKKRVEDTLEFLESECCVPCREEDFCHCDECDLAIAKNILRGE